MNKIQENYGQAVLKYNKNNLTKLSDF